MRHYSSAEINAITKHCRKNGKETPWEYEERKRRNSIPMVQDKPKPTVANRPASTGNILLDLAIGIINNSIDRGQRL